MAPTRRQTIIWTKDGYFSRTLAWLGLNELMCQITRIGTIKLVSLFIEIKKIFGCWLISHIAKFIPGRFQLIDTDSSPASCPKPRDTIPNFDTMRRIHQLALCDDDLGTCIEVIAHNESFSQLTFRVVRLHAHCLDVFINIIISGLDCEDPRLLIFFNQHNINTTNPFRQCQAVSSQVLGTQGISFKCRFRCQGGTYDNPSESPMSETFLSLRVETHNNNPTPNVALCGVAIDYPQTRPVRVP